MFCQYKFKSALSSDIMDSCLLFFAGFVLLFGNCYCIRMLQLIPGTPTILYINKKYAQDVVFTTRRYGRKSDYVVNLEFTTLTTFGNNVSVSIILYEYLHNEYRRSFVELHGGFCQMILKDQIVGKIMRNIGFNVCPVPAGRHHLLNVTFNYEFPNVFPFEKGKGELLLKQEPSGQVIAHGDLVLTFKQKVV